MSGIMVECPACHGTGMFQHDYSTDDDKQAPGDCPECNGTGEVYYED